MKCNYYIAMGILKPILIDTGNSNKFDHNNYLSLNLYHYIPNSGEKMELETRNYAECCFM